MNENPSFANQIRDLVAQNDLPQALQQLRVLLQNSPKLDKAILQTARFHSIREQIQIGTVSHENAEVTENQIRAGILELLNEIEAQQAAKPELREEARSEINIASSKNVNTGKAEAGRDIHFGDKYYAAEQKLPRILTNPPFNPPIFLGRDEALQEVHDQLFGGSNLLLLYGEGGMGKTSFAAKYWERYENKYQRLAFLYVGNDMANALLSIASALELTFPDPAMLTAERLELLIRHMANLEKPCLLILDNANDEEDLEKNYALLGRCSSFHILLTSRLKAFQEMKNYALKPLEKGVALDVFKIHYPKHQAAEDALFWGVFDAVQGNTLVLEILAKNLREINQNEAFYPLSELLKDLQSKGLLQLSEQAKVKVHWQDFEKAEPEQIIQALYDLRPLQADELWLLSNFAALPPENIAYTMLKDLLKPEDARAFSDTLSRLHRKGWIEKSEASGGIQYKISPVVQEIVKKKNPKLLADCETLIATLNEKLEYEGSTGHFVNTSYEEARHFARYAEAVFYSISEPDTGLYILTDYIGRFHQTTGNLEQAFVFYEEGMQVCKALCAAEPDHANHKDNLAISCQNLGNTHTELGNLEAALAFYEQFNQLEKELHESAPQNVEFKNGLAISYSKLGDTHSILGNLKDALAFYKKDIELSKELHQSFPQNVAFKNGLAISCQNLGNTHRALGNLEAALSFYEQCHQLEKELHESASQNVEFKNGLAISCQKLGNTHSSMGNLEAALAFYEQYNQLEKELYELAPENMSFKNNLASSYAKLGEFSRDKQQNKDQARSYFLQAEALWLELVRDAPQYAKFQKSLSLVQRALAALDE